MRLRCKLQGGGASHAAAMVVELPSAGATLSDLLRVLGSRLGVSPDAIALSLNGRDPLVVQQVNAAAAAAQADSESAEAADSAGGATPLVSVGLVSGDLVYVRCATSSAGVGGIDGGASRAATSAAVAASAADIDQHQQQQQQQSASGSSSGNGVPILVGDIGDSPTSSQQQQQQQQLCPSLQLLHNLYYYHSASDSSTSSSSISDALRLRRLLFALHCLMVETGFVAVDPATGLSSPHQWVSQCNEDPVIAANRVLTKYLLPPGQFPAAAGPPGVSLAVHYRYSLLTPTNDHSAAAVLLKVVRAGDRLAICHCAVHGRPLDMAAAAEDTDDGVGGGGGTELLMCASSNYCLDRFVPLPTQSARGGGGGGGGYANLRQLSVHFKDSIAERAKSAIHEAAGLPLRGLAGLPTELLLRVMRDCHSAGAVVALGQCCRRLRLLHADNYVWRALLVRDYGRLSDRVGQYLTAERQGHEVNYYEAYRVFHEERTQRRRMLARLSNRELALPAALHDIMPGVMPPFGLPGHPQAPPPPQPLLPLQPERPDQPLWPQPLPRPPPQHPHFWP